MSGVERLGKNSRDTGVVADDVEEVDELLDFSKKSSKLTKRPHPSPESIIDESDDSDSPSARSSKKRDTKKRDMPPIEGHKRNKAIHSKVQGPQRFTNTLISPKPAYGSAKPLVPPRSIGKEKAVPASIAHTLKLGHAPSPTSNSKVQRDPRHYNTIEIPSDAEDAPSILQAKTLAKSGRDDEDVMEVDGHSTKRSRESDESDNASKSKFFSKKQKRDDPFTSPKQVRDKAHIHEEQLRTSSPESGKVQATKPTKTRESVEDRKLVGFLRKQQKMPAIYSPESVRPKEKLIHRMETETSEGSICEDIPTTLFERSKPDTSSPGIIQTTSENKRITQSKEVNLNNATNHFPIRHIHRVGHPSLTDDSSRVYTLVFYRPENLFRVCRYNNSPKVKEEDFIEGYDFPFRNSKIALAPKGEDVMICLPASSAVHDVYERWIYAKFFNTNFKDRFINAMGSALIQDQDVFETVQRSYDHWSNKFAEGRAVVKPVDDSSQHTPGTSLSGPAISVTADVGDRAKEKKTLGSHLYEQEADDHLNSTPVMAHRQSAQRQKTFSTRNTRSSGTSELRSLSYNNGRESLLNDIMKPRYSKRIAQQRTARPALSPTPQLRKKLLDKGAKWESPLLYPATGRGRTTVEYEDLDRLEEGEFLNDNILNFCLKHLELELKARNPQLADKFHFFNTYFYEALTRKKQEGGHEKNIESVLGWTKRANVDLFSKEYIIVPINEHAHWYLAIICNLNRLPRSPRHDDLDPVDNNGENSDATIVNEQKSDVPSTASEGTFSPIKSPVDDGYAKEQSDLGITDLLERDSFHKPDLRISTSPKDRIAGDSKEDPVDVDSKEDPVDFDSKEGPVVVDSKEDPVVVDSNPGQESELAVLPSTPPHPTFIPEDAAVGKEESSDLPVDRTQKDGSRKARDLVSPQTPAIYVLDSLGLKKQAGVFKVLRRYLAAEGEAKRKLSFPSSAIAGKYARVPEQPNSCDCGVYLYHFVRRFTEDPETFVEYFASGDKKGLSQKVDWKEELLPGMRKSIFNLILKLKFAENGEAESKETAVDPAEEEVGSGSVLDESEEILEKNRLESSGGLKGTGTVEIEQSSEKHDEMEEIGISGRVDKPKDADAAENEAMSGSKKIDEKEVDIEGRSYGLGDKIFTSVVDSIVKDCQTTESSDRVAATLSSVKSESSSLQGVTSSIDQPNRLHSENSDEDVVMKDADFLPLSTSSKEEKSHGLIDLDNAVTSVPEGKEAHALDDPMVLDQVTEPMAENQALSQIEDGTSALGISTPTRQVSPVRSQAPVPPRVASQPLSPDELNIQKNIKSQKRPRKPANQPWERKGVVRDSCEPESEKLKAKELPYEVISDDEICIIDGPIESQSKGKHGKDSNQKGKWSKSEKRLY